jgi:hypothetical protein
MFQPDFSRRRRDSAGTLGFLDMCWSESRWDTWDTWDRSVLTSPRRRLLTRALSEWGRTRMLWDPSRVQVDRDRVYASLPAIVQRWYDGFLDPDGHFLRRLTDDRNNDGQISAIDELFIHEWLRGQYVDIRHEEDGRGPDFRVYEDDGLKFSVEVASIFLKNEFSQTLSRHDQLATFLNSRVSPSSGYILQLDRSSEPSPRPSPLVRWVLRKIDELNASQTPPAHVREVYRDPNGTHVDVSFIRLGPGSTYSQNPAAPTVAFGPFIGGFVERETAERLIARLDKKGGSRYEVGGRPFLVAGVIHDPFCDVDTIRKAIHGDADLMGFFGSTHQPRSTRVSAVVAVRLRSLEPNIDASIEFFANEQAAIPWDSGLLGLPAWAKG